MSRPSRNARRDAANPYGAGAYVNPDDIDLDEDKSDDSGDTPRTGSKRRPGRPRRDDGAGYTPATGRRGRDASDGGQAAAVDPYDHITTSKPMGGMVIYNSDPSTRPQKNPHVYFTKAELEDVATHPVKLVPIRIEFDIDNFHLSDTFMWNVNETLITPEQFAAILLADVQVPGPRYQPKRITDKHLQYQPTIQSIALQIRQQCAAYLPAVAEDPEGVLVPSEPIVQRIEDDSEMTPLEEAERQAMDSASDTLRMVIRLDITVGSTHLRDKFEYPVSQSSSKISPEVFARILCADLALQPEFIPSIAHSIREQLCLARIQWEDEMNAPEIGRSGFRIREEDWEPSIREITDSDLVKLAKDRDRNPRKGRRGGRRGFVGNVPTPAFPAYRPSPLNPGVHQFGMRHPRQ